MENQMGAENGIHLDQNMVVASTGGGVDRVRPGDGGFLRMADAVGTVVRHVLEKTC